MRILIVNRHFGNDHVPTGRMARDLAASLTGLGHDVIVLTSKSSYATTCGEVAALNDRKLCDIYTLGERNRLLSWIMFLVQACVRIPFIHWERCLLLTDPPFLGVLSILLHPFCRRRKKIFWWIMDLYPEILVSGGRMSEQGRFYKMLRLLNDMTIRCIDGIILLGACQLDRMWAYRGWKDENYIIVPPWDERPINRVEREENRFIEKYRLRGKKIALYAGNLGEGHTYQPLLEASKELAKAERGDWVFVFVVRGAKKERLIKDALDMLPIMVLDYQPLDWTADLLWSAHVHLITMNRAFKGLVVPSKLYGVLKTEAPVLFIGPQGADTAREITRIKAGMVLEETCVGAEVVKALDKLYALSDEILSDRLALDTTGPEQIANFITK